MAIGHSIEQELSENQAVHVHFWARSAQRNPITVEVLKSAAPYPQSLNERIELTPKWKEYDFDCIVPKSGNGETALHFKLGEQNGQVEFKDINVKPESLTDLHLDPNGLSEQQMEGRIEQNRKPT